MPGRSKTVRTDGKLNLKWTSKHGGGDQITCESMRSTENGPNSQALARLYYYDGIYTTHPKPRRRSSGAGVAKPDTHSCSGSRGFAGVR